jgi:hypothetical protein
MNPEELADKYDLEILEQALELAQNKEKTNKDGTAAANYLLANIN